MCAIQRVTALAKVIDCCAIIVDKAPMTHQIAFEAVNCTLVYHAFLMACFMWYYHVWGAQVNCQYTQRMVQPRTLFILRDYIKICCMQSLTFLQYNNYYN